MTQYLYGPDAFGPLQVPLQAPGTHGEDPALWYIADFLKTFLVTDANAQAAWKLAGVAPTTDTVITYYVGSPSDEGFKFKADALPTIFVYRDGAKYEWWGDDWAVRKSTVRLVWALPLSQPLAARSRRPFIQALEAAVLVGVEWGRTPSWLQVGDPDPLAASQGSLFHTYAGFVNLFFTSSKYAEIRPRGVNGPSNQKFPGVEMTFEMTERLTPGIANRYANTGGVDIKVEDEYANLIVEGTPFAAPAITSLWPTSGTQAGGTIVAITGTGFRAGAIVAFGDALTPATSIVVLSSTRITCTTPADSTGIATPSHPVNVVVTNNDGQSATLSGGFTYIEP